MTPDKTVRDGHVLDLDADPADAIARTLGQDLLDLRIEPDGTVRLHVGAESWRRAAETLRAAGFDRLEFLSCVDWDDHLDLVLQVYSFRSRVVARLIAAIPRADATVRTASDLWPAADWEERETFDQFGVVFLGHPDLRRILNPERWEGHPLLRDYVDRVSITRPRYF